MHKSKPRLSKPAKTRLIWLCIGLCLGITPYIFDYADAHRYSPGTGGEAIFPLIAAVLLCYEIWRLIKRKMKVR